MQQILAQAQKMQEQLLAAKNDLAERHYQGTAGGGMVKAVVTGNGDLVSMTFSPEVVDPGDVEMLGDLVVAAVNAAHREASADASAQMSNLTGGLGDLGGLFG